MGFFFALLTVCALLVLGWAQLVAFRDPFAPWREDAALLLASDWGRNWRWALMGGGIAALAFALGRLRPLALILAPGLALYPAFSGHAAASGAWTPVALAADWLHVVAAGTWMGALIVLLRTRDGDGTGPERPGTLLLPLLPRFSVQARLSVVALVLTGSFASWLHLSGPSALWSHPYGRLLAVKLVLVAGLLALGAWNWRVLSPRSQTPEGARRLVLAARIEAAAGIAVLVVTGWLTGTAPP